MNRLRRLSVVIRYVRKRGFRFTIRKALQLLGNNEASRIFSVLKSRSNEVQSASLSPRITKKWFLVANDLKWASNDYRGRNFCEVFDKNKIKYTFIDNISYLASREMQESTSALILFRTDSPRSDYVALSDRSQIVYDTDDLCFDRRYFNIKNVPGIRETSKSNQSWLLGGSLDGQESIIRSTFVGTGPTKRFTQSMTEIGAKNILILRNVLPSWMEAQARKIRRTGLNPNSTIEILYASGSNTHQEDFDEAISGVFSFLAKNKRVNLTILGYSPFEKNRIWVKIRDQVNIIPPVKHHDLLNFHSKFNVAIAPLKLNEFTEGKSALKFVHAASLGIPCLATPSEPFRFAMKSEFSDLLVHDNNWEKSLNELLSVDRNVLSEKLIDEFERRWTIKNLEEEMLPLFDLVGE